MAGPTKAEMQEEIDRLKAKLENQEYELGNPGDEEPDPAAGIDAKDPEISQVDVDAFLGEFGEDPSDLVVDCYRYDDGPGGSGKLKYARRYPQQEFSLEAVRKTFGGGRWHFRQKTRSGKNLRSKTVDIEGPRRKLREPDPEEDPRSTVEIMTDTHGLLVEALKDLRRGPPPGYEQHAGANPIEMAMSVVAAMQSVIAPYQEALFKREPERPDFKELVAIFQQGMELGKMSGGDGGGDVLGPVIAASLPQLLKAINGGGTAPTQEPIVGILNEAAEKADSSQAPAVQRPGWDLMLARWLPTLAEWARKDKAVEPRAFLVADEIPEDVEALVLAQLTRGEAFLGEFFALHPELRPWESWFRRFWLALANQYEWGGELGPHPFHGSQVELVDQVAEEGPAEEADGVEISGV